MPHPLEYRAACVSCAATGPAVQVDGRQWGEGQRAARNEALRVGWSEIKDAAGGWFREWLCARCAGGSYDASDDWARVR